MLVKNLTGGEMFKHSVYDGNSRPCEKKKCFQAICVFLFQNEFRHFSKSGCAGV